MALLVDLFLPWYSFAGGRHNAWGSLAVTPILLMLAGALAVALFVVTLSASSPALPVALGVWLVPTGLVATLAALLRVLEPPGGSISRCYGSLGGLATAALVLVAAWLSIGDERPARGVPVHAPPAS